MEPIKLPLLQTQENKQLPSTPPTKPTYYVDASLLKKASCMREVIWTNYLGLQAGPAWDKNYKAGYGSAFHRGIEYYYSLQPHARGGEMSRVCEKAVNYYEKFTPYIPQTPREFRTTEHLVETLTHYHTFYGEHDALVPVITGKESGLLETRFYQPWYSGENFDLILVGTIDMIAEYYGELVIVDHKTTSAGGAMYGGTTEYFKGYRRNIQTQFYTHMFEQLSGKRLGVLINGVFLKKQTVEAKKRGVFDGVNLNRSEVFRYTDEQQGEFVEWLHEQLRSIKYYIGQSVKLPAGNHAACQQQFGRCKYFDICCLPQSEISNAINAMEVAEYNPLRFSEA